MAAFAFTTGDRAAAESVVCSDGQWVVSGVGSYNPGANSGIPCDESKPGWVFDWNNPGHIKWVYDGDRVVTPYTTEGSSVVRTAIREVQEQGNTRPPVNQPRATGESAYLYQADANNRAVRGADGQCYREQRIRGQWRRSGAYGATAEACRRASWNAIYRSARLGTLNPISGAFPDGLPEPPVLQAATMGAPSATVNGKSLTLSFNEALDSASRPAPGAFRVTVNGARRSVASGGVAISGTTVTLTLTSAVRGGDTVRVGYTKPSASPLRGASRVPVESFANKAVTNNTERAVTLVSNTGQTVSNTGSLATHDVGQAFTTGSNTHGYKLTAVKLLFSVNSLTLGAGTYTIKVHSDDSGSPGSTLGTLSNPSSLTDGENSYSAAGTGLDLAADTTYWLVVDVSQQDVTGTLNYQFTNTNAEDAGAAAGWAIADTVLFRAWNATVWPSASATELQMGVVGYAKSAP